MVGATLRVPKMVDIRNPRLGILFYTMQVICITTVTWWFIRERAWDSKAPVGSYIHGNVWVQSSDFGATAVDERLAGLNASLCRRLGDYEYWWDEQRRFRNISCAFPCAAGQTERCVGPSESFMAPSQGEVFIPTHRTVTPLGQEWHGSAAQESFPLSAEALTVGLTYHYDMPKYTWDGHLRSLLDNPGAGGRDSASSTRGITTVLVSADGSTEEIPPGRGMHFTVPQLLELSGSRDALDEPHATAGANQNPGSAGEPPLARLSGLELEVSIECLGSWDLLHAKMNTCYLAVHRTPKDWTSWRTVDEGRGEVRVYHGIRVFVRGGGFRSHFSIDKLFDSLATLWVLLTLPRRILFFVCITGLGHLSTIYRQASIDTFRLQNYLAGMSARLLAWNVAFVELVDKVLPNGECGISKSRLHERLRSVLKYRGTALDEGEVQRLTEFCYKAMSCSGVNSSHLSFVQDMAREVMSPKSSVSLGEQLPTLFIDSDTFSVACTSNEHITFDAAVAMFDKDRKRGFLERVFTPAFLTKYIVVAEHAGDSDSVASPEPEQDVSEAPVETPQSVGVISASFDLPLRSETPSDDVLGRRRTLTLEQEKGKQMNVLNRFSQVAQEHEHLSRSHMTHVRELEKHSLALQRVDHEQSELKRLLMTVRSANEKLAGSLDDRIKGLDELHRALGEKQAAMEERHVSALAAVEERQAAVEERQAALAAPSEGAEPPGPDGLRSALAERVAALESASGTESAELHGAIDRLHRSLAERVAALELLLEMDGVPAQAAKGGRQDLGVSRWASRSPRHAPILRPSGACRSQSGAPKAVALPSRTLTSSGLARDASPAKSL